MFKSQNKERLNVIMITADALRADVVEQLPFLSSLIKKSTFFNNMFTYQNNSTGAFYSIFTGIYGTRNNVNSYFGVLNYKRNECKTLTQYFKDLDYFTIGHSMSDIIMPKDGFDKYYSELNEDNIPKLYENMINEILNCGKNFFVHFHIALIHSRIIESVAKKFKYNDKEYYKMFEKNKENYFRYALETDNRIKNLVGRFDLDKCILVIYSDHGTSYGEHFGERFYGSLCYDDTLRTFAIFYGKDFPVFRSDEVLRTVDIMPTILDYLDINEDNKFMTMDGKSLIPVINGNETDRIAFSEIAPLEGTSNNPSPDKPSIHSIRNNKWKLIFNSLLNSYELYDIENDPDEKNSLFGKGLKEEKEMMKILNEHLR